MNLGIESGSVKGVCVGSITSHSSNSNAVILNCYNKAMVQGARAGGIADNFNGTISNCWSECDLQGDSCGGIISYDALAIVNSISIEESGRSQVTHEGIDYIDKKSVDYSDVVNKLNNNIYYSANVVGIDYHELYFWELSEDGNTIIFSKNKASVDVKYIAKYLQTFWGTYFPFIQIFSSLYLALMLVYKSTYKNEKSNNEDIIS